ISVLCLAGLVFFLGHAASSQALCINGPVGAITSTDGPLDQPTCGGGGSPGAVLHAYFSHPGFQDVIDCYAKVDDPHRSTHVPGTANVESHISCAFGYSMTFLSLNTTLWRSSPAHDQIA